MPAAVIYIYFQLGKHLQNQAATSGILIFSFEKAAVSIFDGAQMQGSFLGPITWSNGGNLIPGVPLYPSN